MDRRERICVYQPIANIRIFVLPDITIGYKKMCIFQSLLQTQCGGKTLNNHGAFLVSRGFRCEFLPPLWRLCFLPAFFLEYLCVCLLMFW